MAEAFNTLFSKLSGSQFIVCEHVFYFNTGYNHVLMLIKCFSISTNLLKTTLILPKLVNLSQRKEIVRFIAGSVCDEGPGSSISMVPPPSPRIILV